MGVVHQAMSFARASKSLVRAQRNVVPAAGFATNPLASLFGSGPAEAGTPLTTAFPGFNAPAASAPVKPESQMTTLSNGVRVISENTPGHAASLGVFVGSGSRDETDATKGAAKFMEQMAFKASSERSGFGFHHEIEHMGGVVCATASREDMVYTVDVLKENAGAALEVVAESVLNPELMYHEIEDQKPKFQKNLAELADNSNLVVVEAAHAAAFGGQGLGRSLLPTAKQASALSAGTLAQFAVQGLTSDKIVVAGAGVEHSEFVSQVEAAFSGAAPASGAATVASKYTGGQFCMPGEPADGMTHAFLGFNSASWNSTDLIPMCILQTLMGGGGSFSMGGPGKGMYSRLYLDVLNQYHWIQNATAINNPYSDSGLFGVFGSSAPQDAASLVQVLAEQMSKMAGPISDEELARAKAMTKSSVYMNLESRSIVLEDIGKQVLCYGKRMSADEIAVQIDNASAADLQRVAKGMISTPLTYAAYGEVHSLPRYDVVANALQ